MKKKVLKGFRSRDVVAGFLSQIWHCALSTCHLNK